jgi:hypothetical protein
VPTIPSTYTPSIFFLPLH